MIGFSKHTFHSNPPIAIPAAAPVPAIPTKCPLPMLLAKREAPIWIKNNHMNMCFIISLLIYTHVIFIEGFKLNRTLYVSDLLHLLMSESLQKCKTLAWDCGNCIATEYINCLLFDYCISGYTITVMISYKNCFFCTDWAVIQTITIAVMNFVITKQKCGIS